MSVPAVFPVSTMEIRSLLDERRRRERELAALHETAVALLWIRDLDELLRIVARHVRQLLGADLASVALLDTEHNRRGPARRRTSHHHRIPIRRTVHPRGGRGRVRPTASGPWPVCRWRCATKVGVLFAADRRRRTYGATPSRRRRGHLTRALLGCR
jgi:hypothetical protein